MIDRETFIPNLYTGKKIYQNISILEEKNHIRTAHPIVLNS